MLRHRRQRCRSRSSAAPVAPTSLYEKPVPMGWSTNIILCRVSQPYLVSVRVSVSLVMKYGPFSKKMAISLLQPGPPMRSYGQGNKRMYACC